MCEHSPSFFLTKGWVRVCEECGVKVVVCQKLSITLGSLVVLFTLSSLLLEILFFDKTVSGPELECGIPLCVQNVVGVVLGTLALCPAY